jgi:hypothetical protein
LVNFFHMSHLVICVSHGICIVAGNVQLMSAYMQCGLSQGIEEL